MSKQSQEIQDHVMTVNMEAQNLSETKLRGRLLASKYQVKQGSSFQVKVIPGSDRKPALSFMKPFGCPVTILNTIDHLGKFDGKADEGFFVGYSTNSKAFRVFNSRTRIVKENLHVQFSENTPNIAGSGPNWLFDIDALTKSMNYKPVVAGNQSNGSAGTKACDNVGKARVETVPGKDYILLPLWTQDPPFSSSSKDSPDAGFKPSREEEKKDVEDPGNEDSEVPSTEEPRVNQEKDANVNSTNNINTVSPTDNAAGIEDNVVDENIVYGWADMNNLDTIILVSPVPTTRTHKHHPLEQMISFLALQRSLGTEFEKMMHKKFQMSSMGELIFFLGLQVKQKKDEIFISPRQKGGGKTASTPMETQKLLLKDEDGEEMEVHLYRSMMGSLMYLTSSRPDIITKTTAWNEFSSTMASAFICLATNQKFNFSKYIFESMVKNSDNAFERAATTATGLDAEQDSGNINKTQSKATHNKPSSPGTSSGGGPRRQETIGDTIAQTRSL
ncbi:ribonuclease H-like domain-containing protein [Tanacetum coccineum]